MLELDDNELMGEGGGGSAGQYRQKGQQFLLQVASCACNAAATAAIATASRLFEPNKPYQTYTLATIQISITPLVARSQTLHGMLTRGPACHGRERQVRCLPSITLQALCLKGALALAHTYLTCLSRPHPLAYTLPVRQGGGIDGWVAVVAGVFLASPPHPRTQRISNMKCMGWCVGGTALSCPFL